VHTFEYSGALKLMEPPDRVEVDPYADNQVPVTEGDEQFAEAVGELPQDDGLDGQSDNGTPLEAGDGHDGLPPLATGNGHVAAASGPPTGSIQEFVEASTAQPVLDPVLAAALPAQPLSVSGAYVHAPPIGTMPGVRSRLPDPSELKDAIFACGTSASTGWADDARADYCDCSNCHYDHSHTINCSICSADWTGVCFASRSSCTDSGGVCSPSRIRTCRSSIPFGLDIHESTGSRGTRLS